MKLFILVVLVVSFCIIFVILVIVENIVGLVKVWQYMQVDGWKFVDGYDDNCMYNELYQVVVFDNYFWMNYFLFCSRGGSLFYLVDKKVKIVKYIDIKFCDEYLLYFQVVYWGIDDGSGCYFVIVDD